MIQKKSELRFGGHDTFPLKQLWLRKAVRFSQDAHRKGKEPAFRDDQAIVQLGLGKNMVSSLRFWAVACGFLDPEKKLAPTEAAQTIFGEDDDSGLDPFMQCSSTAWLAHWNLCSNKSRLTAFWFLFNCVTRSSASRDHIWRSLLEYARSNGSKVSESSLRRDVEVCLRSYAPQITGRIKESELEEVAETLFGDLGLLLYSSRDVVEISRLNRYSLPTPLFFWCVLDYWERDESLKRNSTLDWFQIAFAENSPGRVFKLAESDLNARLDSASEVTEDLLVWTDQLGIKSLVRRTDDANALAALKEKLLADSYR